MKQEQFERWLAGLPADLHDPRLRNATLVAPTILGATLDTPTINNAVLAGVTLAPASPFGSGSNQIATNSGVLIAVQEVMARFVSVLQTSGQLIQSTIAGTYLLGTQSQALLVGLNALQPPQTTYIEAADLGQFAGVIPKLRIRFQLFTNATAPTGNFTVGLFPITGTSGVVGGITYAVGPMVSGSDATTLNVGANVNVVSTSSEFAPPPDGFYALGLVTTATTAVASHCNICAQLRRTYAPA